MQINRVKITSFTTMKHLKYLVIFSSLVFGSCLNDTNKLEQDNLSNKEASIKNGIYLILNEYADSLALKNPKGLVIPFSHSFLDSNTKDQPLWLEIDTTEYVSLELAEKPNGEEQADKRINLTLTLTDKAKAQLADFTGRHVMDRVAIVIGGQAVTKHKVRERIDGGRLQIVRCTDNACQYLLMELKKSYK